MTPQILAAQESALAWLGLGLAAFAGSLCCAIAVAWKLWRD